MIKTITAAEITAAVAKLCIDANLRLPDDVAAALDRLLISETTPLACLAAEKFAENRRIAASDKLPLCQDTGTAVFFVELGNEVQISGGLLPEAINAGVAQGYREGYLRKSIVHPLTRVNTGDNTPAIIHTSIVSGDNLSITLMPKGGGAENMSRLAMLQPADGIEGIKNFVINAVREAGPNPCPPVIVGVGIGGNFETVPLLAKQAMLREIGSINRDPQLAQLESVLLCAINQLNIGVQGFGGPDTALAVFAQAAPCHLASLPAAVNINCHVARHGKVIL